MFVVIILVPFLIAATAVVARARGARGVLAVAGVGLALAAAFVLFAYLKAPTDRPPFGCSDCGRVGGHYWDPAAVFVVLIFSLGSWLVGTGAGAAVRRFTRR
jgi:hypothetical protein